MIQMQMSLGEVLRLTLFGTSHGPKVGAFLEGVPAGISVDYHNLENLMSERRPGGRYASKRREPDKVEFLSGIDNGVTTGGKIEISNENKICIIAGPCQLETEQHAMDLSLIHI